MSSKVNNEKVHAFTDEVQEMSWGKKKQESTVTMTQFYDAEDKVNLAMVTDTDGGGVVASRALTWVCRPPKAEGQTGHLFASNLLVCRAYC